MKNLKLYSALIAAALSVPGLRASVPLEQKEALTRSIECFRPGTTAIGRLQADSVGFDPAQKTATIVFSEAAAYLPLDKNAYKALEENCREILGPEYKKYRLKLFAGTRPLDNLVLYSTKKNVGPKEKDRFITRVDAPAAPAGLEGDNIALWQSHGWYFEPKLNRWEWQRARVMQTVEDLYTQSYVMPFLMPMLENAGAYVMSPRERDTSTTELIIDNDPSDLLKGEFVTEGQWSATDKKAFAYTRPELHNGDHPFADGTSLKSSLSGSDKATATALWKAAIPATGSYAVYVSYTTLPNSTSAAIYRVHAADGTHTFKINQKMGGGTWIYLGHFTLDECKAPATVVELINSGRNKKSVVTADAVKIGGGMGNVARIVKDGNDSVAYEYVSSQRPRFVEGARYFLQWAGAPDSVFTPSDYVNDYTDDYRSRGLWVNWLAGGSSMLPGREGLNIPVDLSFAFHSDAGTTLNDSIIGTLGIYSTAGDVTGNGSCRSASRDLTNDIMTAISDDVRASFEPHWTRRQMWDKSYFEARVPEVPAMLLELLSHQNLADMSYGLDPAFRFTVSRAIYKGMLKFLARRDGRPYVVQPLPVRAFAIGATATEGTYLLSWKETTDTLETTATPTYYIIEERTGTGAFRRIATVSEPFLEVTIGDSDIHSYRVIAANDGGTAFPSEVLALCNMPGKKNVTVVNGFTRVSAPDRFDAGDISGFYDNRDHGVPYIADISYVGSQYEFRRNIPWMDDDAPGFGASRSDYEDKVIAGNTFDYIYTHGESIREAGFGFVSSSVEAFTGASDTPAAVDLILGKQKEIKRGRGAYGTYYKTFPVALQQRIETLAGAGTDFFISGAFVASDLWDNPYSDEATANADQRFAREVLGYNWRVGQAATVGGAYQVPTFFKDFGKGEYKFVTDLNSECYAVESPDSFYPADKDKGCTFLRYTENNLVAGTAFDNNAYRTVVVGFPFETIEGSEARAHLMRQILNFFNEKK